MKSVRNFRVLMALGLAALFFGPAIGHAAAAKADRESRFIVDGWAGRSYHDSESGKFSHCEVESGYAHGIRLQFVLVPDHGLMITLMDKSWLLTRGDEYRVTLYVDRTFLGNYDALVDSQSKIAVLVGDDPSVLHYFAKGDLLRVVGAQDTINLALDGSAKALARLKACVDENSEPKIARRSNPEAKRNPFAAKRDPSTEVAESSALGLTKASVARLLMAAGIENPRFVTNEEIRGFGGFTWLADGMGGTINEKVKFPSDELDILLEAKLEGLRRACKGVFRTTKSQLQGLDDYRFQNASTLCLEDDRKFRWFLTIVGYRDAVVTFGVRARLKNAEKARKVSRNIRRHFIEIIR